MEPRSVVGGRVPTEFFPYIVLFIWLLWRFFFYNLTRGYKVIKGFFATNFFRFIRRVFSYGLFLFFTLSVRGSLSLPRRSRAVTIDSYVARIVNSRRNYRVVTICSRIYSLRGLNYDLQVGDDDILVRGGGLELLWDYRRGYRYLALTAKRRSSFKDRPILGAGARGLRRFIMFFPFLTNGTQARGTKFSTTFNGDRVFFGSRDYDDSNREVLRCATGVHNSFVFKGFYSVNSASGSLSKVCEPNAYGYVRRDKFSNTISSSSYGGVAFIRVGVRTIWDGLFVSDTQVGYFVCVSRFRRSRLPPYLTFMGCLPFRCKGTEGGTAADTRDVFEESMSVPVRVAV